MQKRYYYIDALRVIAILMMFIFHVSMIFVVEWGWHIKNEEQSTVLLEMNFWMSSFRMPLLFFVSGFISYLLIQRMSKWKFAKQRFIRLIIPTVIWTFLLVAPQIYFERLLQGSEQSYLEFYSTFLEFQWYPEGNFHWLHLWFIPYLFIYNIASIPIVWLLKKNNTLTNHLQTFFDRPYSPLVLVGVAILPYTFLYSQYPASYDLVNDWARHSFFLLFVLAGLLFYRFQSILQLLENHRRKYLALAFLSICTINVLRWNGWEPFQIWIDWPTHTESFLYLALLNFNSWMWVLCSLAYGKKYLNKGNTVLVYANNAVYPFYILHQTVIVVVAYYIVQINDTLALKYSFLILVCFAIIMVVYHILIRSNNLFRFLFGMKPLRKNKDIKVN